MLSFDSETSRKRDRYLDLYQRAKSEVQKVMIGLDEFFDSIFICLVTPGRMPKDVSGSHLLVEAPHGLGKSKMIMVVAKPFKLNFVRIQFDPEILPSDIRGFDLPDPDEPWNEEKSRFRRGPIFNDLVMADEINRAATKSQSALLQAMEERAVSVGGNTYALSKNFRLLATINPCEVGTAVYELPAAQIDRFLINQRMSWLSKEQEEQVIAGETLTLDDVEENIVTKKDLEEISFFIEEYFFNPLKKQNSTGERSRIISMCRETVNRTRLTDSIEVPASTRAGIDIKRVAACLAFLSGKDLVLGSHVAKAAQLVLPQRLRLVEEYSRSVEEVILEISDQVSAI